MSRNLDAPWRDWDGSYHGGFEDALELCLSILDGKGLEEARDEIQHFLALCKEEKFQWIREHLTLLEKPKDPENEEAEEK